MCFNGDLCSRGWKRPGLQGYWCVIITTWSRAYLRPKRHRCQIKQPQLVLTTTLGLYFPSLFSPILNDLIFHIYLWCFMRIFFFSPPHTFPSPSVPPKVHQKEWALTGFGLFIGAIVSSQFTTKWCVPQEFHCQRVTIRSLTCLCSSLFLTIITNFQESTFKEEENGVLYFLKSIMKWNATPESRQLSVIAFPLGNCDDFHPLMPFVISTTGSKRYYNVCHFDINPII